MAEEMKGVVPDFAAEKVEDHGADCAAEVPAVGNVAADRDPGVEMGGGEGLDAAVGEDHGAVAADPPVGPVESGDEGRLDAGDGEVGGGVFVGAVEAGSVDHDCDVGVDDHPAIAIGDDGGTAGSEEADEELGSAEIKRVESEQAQIKEKLEIESENLSAECPAQEMGENGDLESGLRLENRSVEEEMSEEGGNKRAISVDSVEESGDASSGDVNLEKVVEENGDLDDGSKIEDLHAIDDSTKEMEPSNGDINGAIESNGGAKDVHAIDDSTTEMEPSNGVINGAIESNGDAKDEGYETDESEPPSETTDRNGAKKLNAIEHDGAVSDERHESNEGVNSETNKEVQKEATSDNYAVKDGSYKAETVTKEEVVLEGDNEDLVEDTRSKYSHSVVVDMEFTHELENGHADMNHHSEAVVEIQKDGELVDSDGVVHASLPHSSGDITNGTDEEGSSSALNGIDGLNSDSGGGNDSLDDGKGLPKPNIDAVESQQDVIKFSEGFDHAYAPSNSTLESNRTFSIGAFEFSCGEESGFASEDYVAAANTSSVKDKVSGSSDGDEPKPEVAILGKPYDYIVKMPRFIDDELREGIRLAQFEVDQKTQSRDCVRVKIQKQIPIVIECKNKLDAARVEENAARKALAAKRKVLDVALASSSMEDLNEKISSMEHKMQHETLALKDEKLMIREIKQFKQERDKLYAMLNSQSEHGEISEKKDENESSLQKLKTEANACRAELVKVEKAAKALNTQHNDENDALKNFRAEYDKADSARQEAYAELQRLKKDMYEKNKQFYQYKDDYNKAFRLAEAKDYVGFNGFCADQREKLHQLFAKDDQFRKDYLQQNLVSTIRRLKTSEGRSLGPDEEPEALPPRTVVSKLDATVSVASNVILNSEAVSRSANASVKPHGKNAKSKNSTKSTPLDLDPVAVSSKAYEAEEEPKEKQPSKEEEEARRKEEERVRKEEERIREETAAREKEQRRLEEIAKAKDAEERKKRQVEKAQARADFKAKKDAELKEKEKQKKAKRKEKKRGVQVDDANEIDAQPQQNGPPEPAAEPEIKEKPVVVGRRYSKSAALKKLDPAPLPLRNRSKRRIQPWMWWSLIGIALIIIILVAANILFGFGRSVFQF